VNAVMNTEVTNDMVCDTDDIICHTDTQPYHNHTAK